MVRTWIESGHCRRVHLIAPTAADARDVMVEGESGLLSVSPHSFYPHYEPSKRRLTWPNGAVAILFSADEPRRLRGPQCDGLWADELASWRYADEAWSNALMGLRLGKDPRAFVSTTPKRVPHLKDLIAQPTTVITRGTTYDNKHNLAKTFLTQVVSRYEGTRLGRQEINGELLDDNPKALWHHDQIDRTRVREAPELSRIVVAVDPAITETGDEHGIVVAAKGKDSHYYILADYTTQGSPHQWASMVATAYEVHKADRIVYEDNQGGDMVRHTIQTINYSLPLKAVHASRGKTTRAEPIAALYEQGKVHHVGMFAHLEDQMCEYVPDEPNQKSPDRMDALVWAMTELHKPTGTAQFK